MTDTLVLICDRCDEMFRTPIVLTLCPRCAHLRDTVEHHNEWARPITRAEITAAARQARRTVTPLRPIRRTA